LQAFIDTAAARLNDLKVSDGPTTAFTVSMRQPPIPILRAPIVAIGVLHIPAQNAQKVENVLGRVVVLEDTLKAIGYHGCSTSANIGGQCGLYLAGWDSVEVSLSFGIFQELITRYSYTRSGSRTRARPESGSGKYLRKLSRFLR
jgi:hypothetical protein